jgi:hypothetical protein
VLSRIAKEGRKYGVSLCVVSQRPTKLSSDLLSQCNTIIALRMSSFEDQEYVRASIVDSLQGLLSVLPALRNGEGIVIGQGVSFPFRLHFRVLDEHERPHSGTAAVSTMWMTDTLDQRFLDQVVHRWRYRDTAFDSPDEALPVEGPLEPAPVHEDYQQPPAAEHAQPADRHQAADPYGDQSEPAPPHEHPAVQSEEELSAFRPVRRQAVRRRLEEPGGNGGRLFRH